MKEEIIKFSISVTQETKELLDKVANKKMRSRSSVINIICNSACKRILKISKDKK